MADVTPALSADAVAFTRAGIRRGFIAAQPLAIGVFVYGVTFGLLALGSGLSLLQALLMSATVYSGSAQTAAVGAIAGGAGWVAIITTVILLNARYVMYGATLRPWLGRVSPLHAYSSLYLLGDGNWLMSMQAHEGGEMDAGYVFGSGLAMFVPWMVGTGLGGVVGHWIPSPRLLALDFLLVAFCAALMISLLGAKTNRLPAVVAVIAALVCDRLAPAGWAIVAAGIAGTVTAYFAYDGRPTRR